MTVLVVDDSKFVRLLTVSALNAAGFDVVEAGDGRRALDYLLAHERPALVLVDHAVNGWLFCEELRRHPTLCGIPVVLHSHSETIESDSRVLGAAGYVQKPTSHEAVVEAVRRHSRAV